jgi:hypothetical protein
MVTHAVASVIAATVATTHLITGLNVYVAILFIFAFPAVVL